MIIFNKQQQNAIDETIQWYKTKNKQIWEISGIAGSGKTTIVYHIIKELGLQHDEVLFMAYVGKATLALSLKGNYAQTIHSTIYDIVETPIRDELGQFIMSNGKLVTRPEFVKKDSLPKNIKLIVLDEGRMVGKHIAEDLVSYGIPMIVLGDHHQLDPPFGEPYFLDNPDVVLTEPMRQALDDPIFMLANKATKGEFIKRGKYGDNCFVIDKSMVSDKMLTKSDIIICGRNKTRDTINRYIRYDVLKRKSECPVIGDKLICRQNNWGRTIGNGIFLINGMVGYAEEVYLDTYNKHSITIDFRPDFSDFDYFKKLVVDYKALTEPYKENKASKRSYYNKFEYGYAISTHLSQGSEWNCPLVIYEDYGTAEFKRKSLYTAITRAKKKLILVM